jgi:hypothetical protein
LKVVPHFHAPIEIVNGQARKVSDMRKVVSKVVTNIVNRPRLIPHKRRQNNLEGIDLHRGAKRVRTSFPNAAIDPHDVGHANRPTSGIMYAGKQYNRRIDLLSHSCAGANHIETPCQQESAGAESRIFYGSRLSASLTRPTVAALWINPCSSRRSAD